MGKASNDKINVCKNPQLRLKSLDFHYSDLLPKKKIELKSLMSACEETLKISSMVFFILIGASLFSLVFRGFGGDLIVENFITSIPGGAATSLLIVMIVIFLLGLFLDFFQIVFVIVFYCCDKNSGTNKFAVHTNRNIASILKLSSLPRTP